MYFLFYITINCNDKTKRKMLRNLCLIFCFSFTLINIQAQDSPSQVEFDLLKLGICSAPNYGWGLYSGTELRYNNSQKFAFGIKADVVILGSRTDLPKKPGDLFSYDFVSFVTLIGDYKFSLENNTAFAGLGLGYFNGSGARLTETGLAPMLRIGYILNRFRFVLEFNIPLSVDVPNVSSFTISYPFHIGDRPLNIRENL